MSERSLTVETAHRLPRVLPWPRTDDVTMR